MEAPIARCGVIHRPQRCATGNALDTKPGSYVGGQLAWYLGGKPSSNTSEGSQGVSSYWL